MTDTEHTESATEDASSEEALTPEDPPRMPPGPDAAGTPPATDKTALLHELVAAIRASVAPGVTPEARAAGAAACRAILTALEAQAGQPLVATKAAPVPAALAPPSTSPLARILSQLASTPRDQLTGILSQLAAMPRDQLIDFLAQRLRSALPAGTPAPASAGPRFHLIQIPQVGKAGSGS